MRKNLVMASILLGSIVLGGCNRSSEPVEHYIGVSSNGYVDNIKLSDVKKNNYNGYFLGDGISVETALELSNESLNSLCYGWNWELSSKKYNGEKIKLEEGESEELWGIEKHIEEVDKEEDNVEETQDEESNEGEKVTKDTEPNIEVVVETSGEIENLSDIVGSEVILKSGQVLVISPNYVKPVEEVEEGGEQEKAEVSEEGSDVEETQEEDGGTEPLAETVKAILVTNYSKENRTIKSCVESGWFTLQVDNYKECFGIEPLESEYEVADEDILGRLTESFGNPNIIWEQPTNGENYVKGNIQVVYAYEFPEYTFIVGAVRESISSIYYIPKDLWVGNDEYSGMRSLYQSSYIEVDKSELPEVEEVE